MDELKTIQWQCEVIADAIGNCESDKELPGLSRELRLLLERKSVLEAMQEAERDPIDELARRRADRKAEAAG